MGAEKEETTSTEAFYKRTVCPEKFSLRPRKGGAEISQPPEGKA